nr:MAG TPA: hypothetical protein [Caudoviricetes sp.]
MQALFRIPLLGVKFVSQQSGLCVFRCRLLFCTFFKTILLYFILVLKNLQAFFKANM